MRFWPTRHIVPRGPSLIETSSPGKCRFCSADLAIGAVVCRICMRHQSGFQEWSSVIGGYSTALTAFISAVLAVVTYWQYKSVEQQRVSAESAVRIAQAAARDAVSARQTAQGAASEVTTTSTTIARQATDATEALRKIQGQVDITSNGRKVCAIGGTSTWNEFLELSSYVPPTWTIANCRDFAIQLGKMHDANRNGPPNFRLGCVFVSSGAFTPPIKPTAGGPIPRPNPNCGW
jgi:hypothetical protein